MKYIYTNLIEYEGSFIYRKKRYRVKVDVGERHGSLTATVFSHSESRDRGMLPIFKLARDTGTEWTVMSNFKWTKFLYAKAIEHLNIIGSA